MIPWSNPENATSSTPSHRVATFLKRVAFPFILLSLAALGIFFADSLFLVFREPETFEMTVHALGPWGPLAFIGAQVLQVFVFVLPGDIVQFAGGYLFGVIGGMGLSLIGIALGTALNFSLTRFLGRTFVESLFSPSRVQSFELVLSSPRAHIGFFLLFLIPGLPGKDLLCYVGGISFIPLPHFLALSVLARIPGVLGSSIMGSSVRIGAYTLGFVVLGIGIVGFTLGFFFRHQIRAWVSQFLVR